MVIEAIDISTDPCCGRATDTYTGYFYSLGLDDAMTLGYIIGRTVLYGSVWHLDPVRSAWSQDSAWTAVLSMNLRGNSPPHLH